MLPIILERVLWRWDHPGSCQDGILVPSFDMHSESRN